MAKTTYQNKIDADNDVSVTVVKIGRTNYVLVMDGQYTWATPKAAWDKVVKQEAEINDGDWYTNFCQSLPYDANFCREHNSDFANGLTVERGYMPDAGRTFNWA